MSQIERHVPARLPRSTSLPTALLGCAVALAACTAGSDGSDVDPTTSTESEAAAAATSEPDSTEPPPADTVPAPTDSDDSEADPLPDDAESANDEPLPAAEAFSDVDPIRVQLPYVAPITLPDLSVLDETGSAIEDELGDVAGVGTGLDVLSAECAADGGELEYQVSGDGDTFLDVDTDGSGVYIDDEASNDITVTLNGDGSGTYVNGSGSTDITIVVNGDGSGTYTDDSADTNLSIRVEADGSGVYVDDSNARNLTIEITSDGTGVFVDDSSSTDIELTVRPDGAGTFVDDSSSTDLTLDSQGDGAFTFVDDTAATDLSLEVRADGSGSFRDDSAGTEISITVDEAGNGEYRDERSGTTVRYTTDVGILDPAVLVAGPMPTFAVADSFPPLASLGSLEPPCVTVVRLSAEVLFDFDSDRLRPEAAPVIDELAEALIATGESIEVHGHTDAIGTNEYNQDLSERRAASFTAALLERGVTSEITPIGFGEERPVAPNTKPDGTDDPVGRQLNRRVEVVIGLN